MTDMNFDDVMFPVEETLEKMMKHGEIVAQRYQLPGLAGKNKEERKDTLRTMISIANKGDAFMQSFIRRLLKSVEELEAPLN